MGKWLMVVGCLAVGFGCANTTETGYTPRTLGDNDTVQRGYYAPSFSPEAQQAQTQRQAEFEQRRPDVYR